jgi:hypothetical protein
VAHGLTGCSRQEIGLHELTNLFGETVGALRNIKGSFFLTEAD